MKATEAKEKYPILAQCSQRELIALLKETCEQAPSDTGFADAIRSVLVGAKP